MGNTASQTASPRSRKGNRQEDPFSVAGVPHLRDSEKRVRMGPAVKGLRLELQARSTGQLPLAGGWLSKQHNTSTHGSWNPYLPLTPALGTGDCHSLQGQNKTKDRVVSGDTSQGLKWLRS